MHGQEENNFLAGSGVNAENVKDLMEYTNVEQVHTSCRKWNVDATTSHQNVDFSYDAEKKDAYEMVDPKQVEKMVKVLTL